MLPNENYGSNFYIFPQFIELKSRNGGIRDFMKHVSETDVRINNFEITKMMLLVL